ncbi:hypothetical protein IEQ34_007411 [Dendrobium chrysotoxum]|uniref:Cytochrome c oxidase assembly factor 3 mitochondrial coiled-coil domain-containing protein n=1 Tax=Dendrobium chrysotoxum TaxID=161865 RepID=A0AAV7GS04_DENCH|nr:hypothetical protein IEQ34_007411 [Dendrobium chrysotoxum]
MMIDLVTETKLNTSYAVLLIPCLDPDNDRSKMSSFSGYHFLATKTKNLIVAGGLTGFVFGVYYYTMRAVGGTDELQVAIDMFEELKKN